MRILTFRRFLVLSALGGFAYVHKQRGGDWTMDSIKDTLRHLWSSASGRADQLRASARDSMQRTTGEARARAGLSDERSSPPYSSYSVREDESNRH